MPLSRQNEDERMWEKADELAASGKCRDWLAVERELRELGYRRARSLLDDDHVRERLDRMCAEARKERGNA